MKERRELFIIILLIHIFFIVLIIHRNEGPVQSARFETNLCSRQDEYLQPLNYRYYIGERGAHTQGQEEPV